MYFGFLEVDIHVLDHLHTYFKEMLSPFCNTGVKFEDIGAFMQQYVRDQGLSDKPCHLSLSGMMAKKNLVMAPYLQC